MSGGRFDFPGLQLALMRNLKLAIILNELLFGTRIWPCLAKNHHPDQGKSRFIPPVPSPNNGCQKNILTKKLSLLLLYANLLWNYNVAAFFIVETQCCPTNTIRIFGKPLIMKQVQILNDIDDIKLALPVNRSHSFYLREKARMRG